MAFAGSFIDQPIIINALGQAEILQTTLRLQPGASIITGSGTLTLAPSSTLNITSQILITGTDPVVKFGGGGANGGGNGGIFGIPSQKAITFRNAAGTDNIALIASNSSDNVIVGGGQSLTNAPGIILQVKVGISALYGAQPANSLGTPGGVMIGADGNNNLLSSASTGIGSATMYIGNAAITVVSDIRVKRNVINWTGDPLKVLGQARVVEYEWDDPTDHNPYGKAQRGRYIGMIAQETIEWAPWIINGGISRNCPRCSRGEVCREKDHMMWQVEYEHLVPLIVNGIQVLDRKVTRLAAIVGGSQEDVPQFSSHEERLAALEETVRILREQAKLAGLNPAA